MKPEITFEKKRDELAIRSVKELVGCSLHNAEFAFRNMPERTQFEAGFDACAELLLPAVEALKGVSLCKCSNLGQCEHCYYSKYPTIKETLKDLGIEMNDYE